MNVVVAVVVAVDRPADGPRDVVELPLVGTKPGGEALDALAIGCVGEVGTVGAAALHELRGVVVEHPAAPATEDAGPATAQERSVEHPHVAVGVGERDPVVGDQRGEVGGVHGTPQATRAASPRRTRPAALPVFHAQVRAVPPTPGQP